MVAPEPGGPKREQAQIPEGPAGDLPRRRNGSSSLTGEQERRGDRIYATSWDLTDGPVVSRLIGARGRLLSLEAVASSRFAADLALKAEMNAASG